jgi:hypothetical protein
MLSKSVCKKCVGTPCWWRAAEIEWEEDKEVMCPPDVTDEWARIEGDIPEWCAFKFEQMVAAGMSNVE